MAYTYEQLMQALRNADAKAQQGDAAAAEDARRLAKMAAEMKKGGPRVANSANPDKAAAANVPLSSDQGFGDYVVDRAKQSVRDNVVMPMAKFPAGVSLIDDQGAVTSTPGQLAGVKNQFDKATGTQNLAPADDVQRYTGAGVNAVTDPLNYVFPGGIARNLFGGFLGGVGSEAGGDVGRGFGGEAGGVAGSILGGALLSGGFTAATNGPAARAARAVGDRVKPLLQPGAAAQEVNREAESALRNVFQAAIKSDPTLVAKITKAQNDYKLLNPNAEGVDVPLSAIMQNPVIDAEIRRLAQVDPVFQDIYTRQVRAAQNALERRQVATFGDPTKADERLMKAQPTGSGRTATASKAVEKRKAAIDAEIARVGRDPGIDPEEVTARVTRLVEQKEELARQAAKPLYDQAVLGASSRGVVFEPAVVEDLYRFVQQAQADDLFFRLPTPAGRTNSVFGPRESVDASGKVTRQFTEATPQDIDSLKQAINLGLRKFKDPKDQAFLMLFREKLNDTINRVDPQFRQELASADDFFRETVGIPFNSTTLRKMDRADYDLKVGPIITRNTTAMREFLDATGPDGMRVAQDALASEFLQKVVTNDVIDVTKAKRWLDRNKAVADMLPGFKEQFFGPNGTVPQLGALQNAKMRLDAQFRTARGEKIIEAEGKTATQLLNELRTNPGKVDQFLNTYGKDKDTLNALRSFALDDVLSSGNPMEALKGKKNAGLYNRLFGTAYADRVERLADLAQRLDRNPADVTVKTDKAIQDALQKVTGVPTPQLYSIARDRVASPHQKVFAILTKSLTAKAGEAADRKLAEALLDPVLVRKLLVEAEAAAKNGSIDAGNIAKALADAGVSFAEDVGAGIATGAARGAINAEQEPAVQRQTR
jgi:hypothetical protein